MISVILIMIIIAPAVELWTLTIFFSILVTNFGFSLLGLLLLPSISHLAMMWLTQDVSSIILCFLPL